MLRQKELSYVDKILRQVGDKDEPFGGFAILLVGDPAQIPAVKGRVMWDRSTGGTDHDNFGHWHYSSFNEVIELTEVRRLDDADGALQFLELLDHIRDGDCTEDDWIHTKVSCSKETMPAAEWKRRFEDTTDNVTYIFNSNKEVNAHNTKRLCSLAEPIALIEAEHTGESRSMSDDVFRGLRSFLFLAVFARVVMTSNVCQPAGLVNGSVGEVKDIIYEDNTTAPALPKFVWGKADNTEGYSEHTRRQLPLRLAWAWTAWKAQGQTIPGKLVADLGKTEKEHGLTYTVFSRVTNFLNIGIIGGLTCERFTSKIKNHAKVAPRLREETRLRRLATKTKTMLMALRLVRQEQQVGN
jgi:ATP-dependent DNA helicase PIF1